MLRIFDTFLCTNRGGNGKCVSVPIVGGLTIALKEDDDYTNDAASEAPMPVEVQPGAELRSLCRCSWNCRSSAANLQGCY